MEEITELFESLIYCDNYTCTEDLICNLADMRTIINWISQIPEVTEEKKEELMAVFLYNTAQIGPLLRKIKDYYDGIKIELSNTIDDLSNKNRRGGAG